MLVRKELEVPNERFDLERSTLEFISKTRNNNLIKLLFWYQHRGMSNLVFPYYPYDLQNVLREEPDRPTLLNPAMKGTFEGSKLNHWLWEGLAGVIDGLMFIHDPDKSLIGAHFDLKPANILVDYDGRLIITDFGLARIKGMRLGDRSSLTAARGTLAYQPPFLKNETDFNTESRLNRTYDIWSMACIMVEMIIYILYGDGGAKAVIDFERQLFEEDDPHAQAGQFWKLRPEGPFLKECVFESLEEWDNPNDPYLKKAANYLQNMLEINPVHPRLSASEIYNKLFATSVTKNLHLLREGFTQICGVGTLKPLSEMYAPLPDLC